MKIEVLVRPSAKENKVIEIDRRHYRVSVKAPAKEDKANKALIKVLAKYFKTQQSRLSIASGHKVRKKIIEID